MERQPRFIKKFSKEESLNERQQAAQAIKAKRAEYFKNKRFQSERRDGLRQSVSEREHDLVTKLEALRNLEDELVQLSTSGLKKILNYFRLQKLRADLVVEKKTYEELREQQEKEKNEEQEISEKLGSEEVPEALQEAKSILDSFYKEQKEKWAKSEYTKEDIIENFSEEHLANLSLEDYALLLRRFPGEMTAHVTRQGVRDHIGHMYHTAGEGAYASSFMKMVDDGRLRSPLGVYLVESEKEKAIQKFLHLDRFETKQEALEYLDVLTEKEQGRPGSYVDRTAIHFATEEVADSFYGSEKGNEIFIAYPSGYIASQYYFNGQLNESGGGYWNDQWVWANEERGMDLDAGLVFIPEQAMVDKRTGSRYELDKNRNPIKNSEYKDCIKKVVDSPDFYDFADRAMEIAGRLSQKWDTPELSEKNQKLLEELEPFRKKLEKEFAITDRRLQMAILDYNHLLNLRIQKENEEKMLENPHFQYPVDLVIEDAMKDAGVLYVEARDTISSKEFWEAYFAKDIKKRPSKIIYYKGTNPTKALYEWKKAHGIEKRAQDEHIGFSENHVERNAPEITEGLDRFKVIAEKVITDHFSDTDSSL